MAEPSSEHDIKQAVASHYGARARRALGGLVDVSAQYDDAEGRGIASAYVSASRPE